MGIVSFCGVPGTVLRFYCTGILCEVDNKDVSERFLHGAVNEGVFTATQINRKII